MTDSSRPLAGLRVALVGAGAVGATLAAWLERRGARLASVSARPESRRAAELARQRGAPLVALDALASDGSDLLLLAAPDAALADVAARLAALRQAPVALHVAGALGAEVLAPLRAAGSAVGGFHPLRAFSGAASDRDGEPPARIFFALGGDAPAIALGERLAQALAGTSAVVTDAARPLYHLAATLLAGGITTLAATAFEIRRRAGLPAESDEGYAQLALAALAAALAAGDPAAGITGPAARGDRATFELEAKALAAVAPEALPAVVAMARESLRQRARRAPRSAAQAELAAALENAEMLDLPRDRVLASRREPPG